jgi:hypothetical protein
LRVRQILGSGKRKPMIGSPARQTTLLGSSLGAAGYIACGAALGVVTVWA